MKKRLIAIPIGYKVKFQVGNYDFSKNEFKFSWRDVTGVINKRMFPGYEFKNSDKNKLRYSIKLGKDHSMVLDEWNITEPNVNRLYYDKDYAKSEMIKFKMFESKSGSN